MVYQAVAGKLGGW